MDEIEDIEQLDNDIQQWDAGLLLLLLALNANLLTELSNLIDGLFLRGRSTTKEEWAANMRAVTIWQADMPNLLFRIGFGTLLNQLIARMNESAVRINVYFTRTVPDFDSEPYAEAIRQLTEQTKTLLTSTMEATYSRVVGDVLTSAVLTKSTAAELRNTLTAVLNDNGLSTKGVSTIASSALYQFSRGYSQTIAEGLNLKHYYYMGTQITTTRSFCAERFGKTFTQAEVESWVDQSWAGKIPGTNKQTIYWYCGGFNCRHRLLPVSKRTYSILTNNN
ncbi:hypothetical protein GCM10028808_73290 [Spirosoma migulaei]